MTNANTAIINCASTRITTHHCDNNLPTYRDVFQIPTRNCHAISVTELFKYTRHEYLFQGYKKTKHKHAYEYFANKFENSTYRLQTVVTLVKYFKLYSRGVLSDVFNNVAAALQHAAVIMTTCYKLKKKNP